MGKINGCLKCLFIFFNTLFAIDGCVLIFGAIKSSAYSHQLSEVSSWILVWIWLFAIGVLGISCLGIYAASNEKKIMLKIFAVFMVLGMIIMLIFGIFMVVTRNKFESSFDSISAEVAKSFMKDEELRKLLDWIQQDGQCCGVVNATDWGDNIPNSCECSGSGCKSKPQGVSGPDQIYAQPCSQIIFVLFDLVLKAVTLLCFGYAVTALLGLMISHTMIRQVEHHNSLLLGLMISHTMIRQVEHLNSLVGTIPMRLY